MCVRASNSFHVCWLRARKTHKKCSATLVHTLDRVMEYMGFGGGVGSATPDKKKRHHASTLSLRPWRRSGCEHTRSREKHMRAHYSERTRICRPCLILCSHNLIQISTSVYTSYAHCSGDVVTSSAPAAPAMAWRSPARRADYNSAAHTKTTIATRPEHALRTVRVIRQKKFDINHGAKSRMKRINTEIH